MSIELALYQPEIPQNVGAVLRLSACFGIRVHIIHPTGFVFSQRALRRGGLDYVEHAEYVEHVSWSAFDGWRREDRRRLVLLTTKASDSAYAAAYVDGDILLVGRESSGVPQGVADTADLRIRIPMRPGLRSLNMAVSAALVLGEALRQNGAFEELS